MAVQTVLCDVSQVRIIAPITQGFSGFDGVIADQIITASDLVRNFCRRKFDKLPYTEFFMTRDDAGFSVRTKERPIAAGSVVVHYDPIGRFSPNSFTSSALVEGDDYTVDYENGIVTVLAGVRFHRRGLRIAYTAGYDVDSSTPPIVQVPASIQTATAMQAFFTLRRIRNSQLGQDQQEKARQSLQKFTVSASSGLLSEVQGQLMRYRSPLVGRG
jgi:hypothetical protein